MGQDHAQIVEYMYHVACVYAAAMTVRHVVLMASAGVLSSRGASAILLGALMSAALANAGRIACLT